MVAVEILTPRLRTIITPEGTFEDVYEIPFKIKDAIYHIIIKKEEYSPELAKKLVEEEAKRIAGLIGLKFEV